MENREFVTQWVIDAVKNEYPEDIALVVSHTTLRIDDQVRAVSYFVPITERGYRFGRTFILEGVGFDIWGIDWARLEKFAELEEYNITCLADGEILYARTEEDAERFRQLKRRQAENLSNPEKMRQCALSSYEKAKNIFAEMMFAAISDAKMCAGYVLDYLAQAIAFSNHQYFRKSQTDQIEELTDMKKVPKRFLELYRNVIDESDVETQRKLCHEAVCVVREFLEKESTVDKDNLNYNTDFQMLADWYAELSYTWLRIRYYSRRNDPVKTYMWGILLQQELNIVCDDFGIKRMGLMEHYNVNRLNEFADYADHLEEKMRTIITEGGGKIHEYKSMEEFLHEI